MATPVINSWCPQGHGPQPEGALYCWCCGAHVVTAPPSPFQTNVQAVPIPGGIQPAVAQPIQPTQIPQPGSPAQQQPPVPWPPPTGAPYGVAPAICPNCGVNGVRLDQRINICPQCRWLRPLAPGYKLDCAAFQWAQDGAAMQKLRSIGALNSVARTVSDKVGRPWIEGTFNAVHVSEKQLPKVHEQAVLAARILNLPYLPDVYVSGERMWDAATYGSDTNSFVVLGTALVTSFQGDELLFLLAREMGHCRAGHALWKTVIRFLMGEQGPKGGLMSGGILSMFSIASLVEGAVELPLLAWARQSEITADRAGLLAVRDEKIVRRVLLTWCLRSPMLYKQINIAEWMQQQEDSDDQMSKLSELAMAATPYITRRLKLLAQFARGPELEHWRKEIGPLIQAAKPKAPAQQVTSKPAKDDLRLKCASCGTKLLVPRSVLKGKSALSVKCANAKCGKLVMLKKKATVTLPPIETAKLREVRT